MKTAEEGGTVMTEDPWYVRELKAAAKFGVSLATWRRWVANGRAPRGVKRGGILVYSLKELREWADAGMPPVAVQG